MTARERMAKVKVFFAPNLLEYEVAVNAPKRYPKALTVLSVPSFW